MSLEALITKNYSVVKPTDSVFLASQILKSGKPVVVLDGESFIGVLSLNDMVASGGDTIIDVLTSKPPVSLDDQVYEVIVLMCENNYDFLPVVSNGDFKGVVSLKKLVSSLLSGFSKSASPFETIIELKKELALKNKFLTIIGHDIRNMFNQVLGSIEILDRRLHQQIDDRTQAILKLAKRSAEQVNAAFEGMLLWARVGTGQLPFNPEILSLKNQFIKVVTQFQLAASVKGITINSKLEDDVDLYADKHMLSCILLNLVYNAIKFTPAGGEIWLDARMIDDRTEIIVVDSGIGMSVDQKDELFGDVRITAGTHSELGSGLGLIICKDFVKKHMGKISVDSEPGKGTQVVVSIPNTYAVIE